MLTHGVLQALTSWLPSALLALYQAVILPHLFYNAAQARCGVRGWLGWAAWILTAVPGLAEACL